MTMTATLPVVRVRVSCADAQEYRRARAADFASRGVFVPSARLRPVGARVHLRIELGDRTFGHDGEAVVARHVRGGPRSGYFLKLGGGVDERSDVAPRRPAADAAAPPVEPTPAPAALAEPPIERTPDPVGLADFLFSDLNLGDAALPAGPLVGDDLVEPRPKVRVRVRESPRPTPVPARPPAATSLPRPPAPPERPSPPPAGTPAPAPTLTPPPLPRSAARSGDAPAPAVTPRPAPPAPLALPPMLLAAAADDEAATAPEQQASSSRVAARLRRFRRAAPVIAAVLLGAAVAGGGLLVAGPTRAEARAADFAAELRRADERLRSGRLAGAGTDSALDHLVAARELVPDDPRLTRRLKLLAELFGDLGERAVSRGDLEEARAHFQARVRADPGNAAFRERLREVADRPAPAPGGGAPAVARVGARAR